MKSASTPGGAETPKISKKADHQNPENPRKKNQNHNKSKKGTSETKLSPVHEPTHATFQPGTSPPSGGIHQSTFPLLRHCAATPLDDVEDGHCGDNDDNDSSKSDREH